MEELRKNLVIGGTRYSLAVGQEGSGPPGSDTPGKVGVTYLDTLKKRLYVCTAAVAGTNGIECEWTPAGDLIEATTGGNGSGENGNGGLTAGAKTLLLDLLRNALYPDDYDADGKIAELEVALGTGGDSGDETPDTGDADVTQSGSTLTISGVQDITTITQSGSVLALG